MEAPEKAIKDDLILRESMALQRTIMANQRTLLAYLRSAMYFLIAALSIRNVLKVPYGWPIELILFIFAGVIFISGIIHYIWQKKKINEFAHQIQRRM